jgi:hypothetical protein
MLLPPSIDASFNAEYSCEIEIAVSLLIARQSMIKNYKEIEIFDALVCLLISAFLCLFSQLFVAFSLFNASDSLNLLLATHSHVIVLLMRCSEQSKQLVRYDKQHNCRFAKKLKIHAH